MRADQAIAGGIVRETVLERRVAALEFGIREALNTLRDVRDSFTPWLDATDAEKIGKHLEGLL